jgi:vacuolar protein sorting-associated protein 35
MSSSQESPEDAAVVSKLIHLLNHQDTDVVYEMLTVARNHLSSGRANTSAFIALVFASLKLAKRILGEELGDPGANEPAKAESKEEEKPAEDEATSGNEDESGDKTEEDAKDEGKEEAKEEDSASEEKTSEPKPVSTPKSVR